MLQLLNKKKFLTSSINNPKKHCKNLNLKEIFTTTSKRQTKTHKRMRLSIRLNLFCSVKWLLKVGTITPLNTTRIKNKPKRKSKTTLCITVSTTVVQVIFKKLNSKEYKIRRDSNPGKVSSKKETVNFSKDNPEWYPMSKSITEMIGKSLKPDSIKKRILAKNSQLFKETQS